ncbi:uncharacterized protein METZ01_LOCUS355663 [marine metagenome]|uniref:Uncharacterized protein n=1 Tax=marine metagenome TaxID=408172 RepID=A0A382RYN2_9ZZZZ
MREKIEVSVSQSRMETITTVDWRISNSMTSQLRAMAVQTCVLLPPLRFWEP